MYFLPGVVLAFVPRIIRACLQRGRGCGKVGDIEMRTFLIAATATALMLGLTNVANAIGICSDIGVDLVLEDGTDVGDVIFDCRSDRFAINVSTSAGFVILEVAADLVADANCNRLENGLPAYIGPSGNPRVGAGDATDLAENTRGSRVTGNNLTLSLLGLGLVGGDTVCVVVEAFLFNDERVEGIRRRVFAYNDGVDFAGGPSPHMFENFTLSFVP